MSFISVEHISFSYPQSQEQAVKDVSFVIERGSYTAIVGSNGSGKSTLARLICGLIPLQDGRVDMPPDVRIGLVFQSPKNQLVSGIVSRDTAFGPQNLGLKSAEVELRTIECLSIVDLLEKASSSTYELSLGQTQKVALSGMLAVWPEVLILDEALAMLDPCSRRTIYEFLRYWHRCGNTIIHITHNLKSVQEASNVIAMERGSVFFYGRCGKFLEDPQNRLRIEGEPLPVSEKGCLAASQEKTLEFRSVSFSYGRAGNTPQTPASMHSQSGVDSISFSLSKGTLTALTGASGAGKSTILELGSGLLRPSSGQIFCVDKPVLVQQSCADALFETFAADDVAFGLEGLGLSGSELRERVKSAMDKAGLPFEEFGERHTFELSGGEQRRLAIAGMIVLDRPVMFFDEPTAGLDGRSRHHIMQLLRTLADEGRTVLFSTHRNDEALFADHRIEISGGRLSFDSAFPENAPAVSGSAQNSAADSQTAAPASVGGSSGSFQATPVSHKASSSSPSSQGSPSGLTELAPYPAVSMLEALRSAATAVSGSHRSKKSLMERLPVVARILLFLVLFVVSLAVRPLWACAAALAASLVYCFFCSFKLRRLLRAMLKILPFLLFFAVFQLIFRRALPDEPHFTTWKWFMITPSKLLFCLASILRTYASLSVICGFFVSTPEYDLIDGLKILLHPLELIKIPVRYFILIMEIVFRFIPLLVDEAISIIKTQALRGGLGDAKGRMAKIRAVLPLVVPLIIQTIKRSEKLADAITMRGFK